MEENVIPALKEKAESCRKQYLAIKSCETFKYMMKGRMEAYNDAINIIKHQK